MVFPRKQALLSERKEGPGPAVFCVIPAYNEEQSITRVVKEVQPLVDRVIVVDDGSGDKTAALAKSAGAVVLRHIINRGQGAALETGNEYAIGQKADIIVHFDADAQFLAEEINDMVSPLVNDSYDIVFGSRFLGKRSEMPWGKEYLIMPLGRLVNRLLIGHNFTDPQNGFRAMTAAVAGKIHIGNDGMAHNSEIQQKAVRNRLRVKEVPVTVRYDKFGQTFFSGKGRGAGGLRIVIDLLLSKLTDN
jgi:polyprenyl-phospho-N-acetylgalactosaminyl synthase